MTWTGIVLTVIATGCGSDANPASQVVKAVGQSSSDQRQSPDRPQGRSTDQNQDIDPSDAEPLDPSVRYLIIHADDAGMCRSVNRGTIEVLEAGVVTSVSMMVPCPAFEEFAEYAQQHPEYDYGVHLTLNAEYESYRWGPVLPRDEVPSLVDREGYLWRTGQQTAANARADEVERELRAQIDRALEFNVPLTHLDTHMGTLFMRPDLVDIYARLGTDYHLPVLLTRDDTFLRQLGVDDRVITLLDDMADALEERGFPVLDNIRMHYERDSVSSKKRFYLETVRRADVGVTEIIIHCGLSDSELKSITLFSHSVRDGDRQVFTDPAVISEIKNADVKLISWRQLHQMTSSGRSTAD